MQVRLPSIDSVDAQLRAFESFLANVPILYLLKTPENQKFSSVFTGYNMRTLARNE